MYICSNDKIKPAYLPAFERWSLYKSIWMNHWEEFQRIYNTRFLSKYGELSDGKKEEVEKLLGCGNFQNGFQRYSCEECDVNKDEIGEQMNQNILIKFKFSIRTLLFQQ